MADTQSPKQSTTKRRVKNPETFRERALKATEADDKPSRSGRLRHVSQKASRPIFKPLGAASRKVAGLKSLQFLGKPLRIFGKILLPVYFRKSWQELRLVKWPSRKESRDLTVAVIIFASVFGIIVAIVDFGLDKLFRNVLLK